MIKVLVVDDTPVMRLLLSRILGKDHEIDVVGMAHNGQEALDLVKSAVAIYGPDKTLRFANQAFATLWGLDPQWLAAGPTFGEVLERLVMLSVLQGCATPFELGLSVRTRRSRCTCRMTRPFRSIRCGNRPTRFRRRARQMQERWMGYGCTSSSERWTGCFSAWRDSGRHW